MQAWQVFLLLVVVGAVVLAVALTVMRSQRREARAAAEQLHAAHRTALLDQATRLRTELDQVEHRLQDQVSAAGSAASEAESRATSAERRVSEATERARVAEERSAQARADLRRVEVERDAAYVRAETAEARAAVAQERLAKTGSTEVGDSVEAVADDPFVDEADEQQTEEHGRFGVAGPSTVQAAATPSGPHDRADDLGWRHLQREREPWVIELRVERDEPTSVIRITKRAARLEPPAGAVTLTDLVAGALAETIADATWPTITQQWIVTDPGHFNAASSGVDAVDGALHTLLLSDPVKAVARSAGAPDPLADAAGVLAAQVPLPGDRPAGTAALVLRLVGIAAGIALGQPVFALASTKDLVRQAVTRGLSEALVRTLDGLKEIPPELPRPVGPSRAASASVVPLRSEPVSEPAPERVDDHEILLREAWECLDRRGIDRSAAGPESDEPAAVKPKVGIQRRLDAVDRYTKEHEGSLRWESYVERRRRPPKPGSPKTPGIGR